MNTSQLSDLYLDRLREILVDIRTERELVALMMASEIFAQEVLSRWLDRPSPVQPRRHS